MTLEEKITAIARNWGRKLSQDLRTEMNLQLGNVQESGIQFNEVVTTEGDAVSVQIVASDEYWIFIEEGRKPNSKMPPEFDKNGKPVLGLKWQGSRGIQPKKVIAEIQLKSKKKGLSRTNKALTKTSKGLSTESAAKQLSFLIRRSIGKKGIEPKPFVEKVVTNERVLELAGLIGAEIGKDIASSLSFKGSTTLLN